MGQVKLSSVRSARRTRGAVLAVLVAAVSLGALAPRAGAIIYRVSKNHYLSYAGILGKPHPSNVTPPAVASSLSPFDLLHGNVDYSGGPVMPSSTNYVVVWRPSGAGPFQSGGRCGAANSQGKLQPCTGYVTGLTTFFKDLAHDSGQATNSDSVSTQYNDTFGGTHWAGGPGPGDYSSTYGGELVDTHPYPPSGCAPARSGGVCLTDAQIQAELQRFLSARGEPGGLTHEYFLFTPPNVVSCIGQETDGIWDCSGNALGRANQVFCAYHGITLTPAHYVYANIPDLDRVEGCDPFSTPSPSGNAPINCLADTCLYNSGWAEGVLSEVSHEHNESVTDPEPNNAWTDWGDGTGSEIGDKCNNDALDDPHLDPDRSNGHDGSHNGRSRVTPYNEVINGHFYLIQQEWSNDGEQCLDHWSLSQGETFPTPTFTVSRRSGDDLTFDAGASCTGSAACLRSDYVWQFNDDVIPGDTPQQPTEETTSPKMRHFFPQPGVYNVALTIMSDTGLSHGVAEFLQVYAVPIVHIAASASRLAGAPISFSSARTTHDPSLTIQKYMWYFGDGTSSTAADPRHTYAKPGTYPVKLTVTDSAGQVRSATRSFTVTASCRVPKVIGEGLGPAETAITAAGCAVGKVTRPGTSRKGSRLVVHSQFPVAARIVPQGSAVNLVMVWVPL